MSKFRSVHRTVVTEIKAFVVDTVSRSGVFRQSVSARVPDDGGLHSQDINVSKTQSFTVENTDAVLALLCPEPVRLVFTQMEELTPGDGPQEPTEPQYTNGQIVAPETLVAGHDLVVSVIDPDPVAAQKTLEIVVFNSNTGETETMSLQRSSDDTFVGVLKTTNVAGKGEDFDGEMNLQHGQYVRIIYRDHTSASGDITSIEQGVSVESPYSDSKITANSFIFPGKPISVIIEDMDVAGSTVATASAINDTTGETATIYLAETEPGVFSGQLDTVLSDPDEFDLGNDTVLFVSPGDQVRVVFSDDLYVTTGEATAVVEVRESAALNGVLTGPTTTVVGASVSITLSDYNQSGAGRVDLPVSNLRSREYEMVALTETVPNTGVFTGTLRLKSGTSVNNNGELGVEEGDTVQAVYIDISSVSGNPERIAHDILVVAAEPVEDVSEPSNDSETPTEPAPANGAPLGTVEMMVDGLFFLNGKFPGKVRVFGLSDELTRCSLLSV